MTSYNFETSPQRSELMRKIKSTNTKPEISLRKALWDKGIRYRLNVKSLPGSPDIYISKAKLVIFVDGEFWHGYNWAKKKPTIKANREYWIKKIERNMERDQLNDEKLKSQGFQIVRFWGNQIKADCNACVSEILTLIAEK